MYGVYGLGWGSGLGVGVVNTAVTLPDSIDGEGVFIYGHYTRVLLLISFYEWKEMQPCMLKLYNWDRLLYQGQVILWEFILYNIIIAIERSTTSQMQGSD